MITLRIIVITAIENYFVIGTDFYRHPDFEFFSGNIDNITILNKRESISFPNVQNHKGRLIV